MKKEGKYDQYTLADFLSDEDFQDWIIKPDAAKDAFWEAWLLKHPGKEEVVHLAKEILRSLDFKVNKPSAHKAQAALEKVLLEMENRPKFPKKGMIAFIRSWRAAAILLPLIGVGLLFFWQMGSTRLENVATAFGEMSRVTMPDSSFIMLNANSTLTYKKAWKSSEPRELWLKGEAFFEVKHLDTDNRIEAHERFLVHTKNIVVEVLGTSFNIRERRGETEISLQEGSIKVSFRDSKREPLILKPGDILKIDPEDNIHLTNNRFSADNSSAWSEKKLILNNPTLAEIFRYLEDIYGKKFVFKDPNLAEKKLEGPIHIDSLEDALFIISTALNVSFTNEKDTILVNFK
ncbi:MAG: FecR domain-containing protein [Niabella sp.]